MLDQPHNNLFAFQKRVDVQALLQRATSSIGMDVLMENDGHSIRQSLYIPATTLAPRAYYCLTDDRKLFVFVSGVETPAQGQALWTAYTDTTQNGAAQPNSWYAAASDGILGNPWPLVETCAGVWMCGFSAGGGVCLEMQRQWEATLVPRPAVDTVTIGSPKPCASSLLRTMHPVSCSAWFNADDPVPLIPPPIGTFERIMAGLSVWQGRNLASYNAWPGGINIGLDGRVTPATAPQSGPTPATEQIGNWLKAQEAGLQTPHSLTTYQARVAAAIALLPPSDQMVNPVIDAPHPTHTSTATIRRAIASTVQTQFYDASRMNGQPVVIPDQRLFVPKKKGKVYYVDFGGVTIAVAPRKRRARALARLGNDFLRRLQNEGVVYTDDLATQFGLYLAAAADPTSGITPTMNTRTS
jgi:hypothetical protein